MRLFVKLAINPAKIFVFSFLFLIILGTLLLLLPISTNNGISVINALFTATSAVCVTGLAVENTAYCFSQFGQIVILVLIQLGGLGILTFAIVFSHFFKGGLSYDTQLAMSNISSTDSVNNIFKTLRGIIFVTLGIELMGAICIFMSLDPLFMPEVSERVFFSVFHSISAFCNAGFSTLPDGLMQVGYQQNYGLLLSIAFLIILGSLGFGIITNLLTYTKHLFYRLFHILFRKRKNVYKPWVVKLGSKINLVMMLILIVVGTVFILIAEQDNVLKDDSGIGKLVTAFFTSVTPRTAGFNSIDFNQMHLGSIFFIIFLMWIGASPASTGGGIKTSTFAIAILNIYNLLRGKDKIEVFGREIAEVSVKRAFAVIFFSIVVPGIGIILISYFENNIRLEDIIFECYSAYSTVGLSLGITPNLAISSKLVLIFLMFIGRVTTLTLLIAFFRQVNQIDYSYPKEEILIN